ncbi:hypothetical protein [Paraprevotella xylaniphila]|nr:hypothetical protein [Paraprevotella xylaniphila]
MKKSLFMKVLALLFVGAGALAYSCSGDDIFEEEEDARSLAKRAMSTRGEHSDAYCVNPVTAGSYTGTSLSKKCDVSVSWNAGYIGGTQRIPQSELTVSVSRCSEVNASIVSVDATWYGGSNIGVFGTISYTYEVYVKYIDEYGNEKFRWEKRRGSDSYDFPLHLNYITPEELEEILKR